jgi:hypothetical protein
VRNEKNAPRYEMHYTLYREIEADRIKDAFKGVKEYIQNSEPKPAQAYTAAPEEDPYPPVGATYTLEDGTIVERWTPERYRVLEQELLALDSLRRTAEMHQVEIERLQVSYEAHIATYENQVNYLRESLTKNIELANKMAVLMEQRNYIEANTKTNNQ